MAEATASQTHEHHPDMPDTLLLERVQAGCALCFSLLFHRYRSVVYSIAWRILRDRGEAEDIVQEVFLYIHLQRYRYDSARGTVKVWILHDVHFRALTRRRQLNGASLETLENGHSENEPVWRARNVDLDGIHAIARGLTKLNDRQRRVIELVHFEGYTLLECSASMGESLANTRNLYYRGMRVLREALRPASLGNLLDRAAKHRETAETDVCIMPTKAPILGH